MLVPTKRLWFLLALGIPLALGGVVVPGLERLVLAYDLALALLFVVTGLLTKRLDVLSVGRRIDPVLSVRQPNKVELWIENSSAAPLEVHIHDDAPNSMQCDRTEFRRKLRAGDVTTLSYEMTPTERGEAEFGDTWIRILAPLGLCWAQKRMANPTVARVYPNVAAVKEFELLQNRGHLSLIGMRKSKIKGLGQEFESLREYNDDDYRTVDWKASARKGKLVVRNYETERNQAVVICIDLGRHMMAEVDGVTKLDHVLDSVLMLMHAAERQGDQVGLLLFNDKIQKYIAPRKGRAHTAMLIDAMFDARAEPVQPDYTAAYAYLTSRWKRRSLCVLFSDAENEDQATDLVSALGAVRRQHKLIVVRVSDPALRELRSLPMTTPGAMFSRSAALWYLNDRWRAELVLNSARITSLESEPKDLAATLVQAYVQVKQRALI